MSRTRAEYTVDAPYDKTMESQLTWKTSTTVKMLVIAGYVVDLLNDRQTNTMQARYKNETTIEIGRTQMI